MSKLNIKRISTPLNPAPFGLGVSGNGNVQVKKDPLNILFENLVSTLYGKDSYYESANETVERMKTALAQVVNDHGLKGVEYAGRVAMFAREHMHIRTMPIVMVVELAKILQERNMQKTTPPLQYKLRSLTRGVISRADELTDMFAYALTVFGDTKKIPMGLKRGVADAFNKFDAYQFGKYNRKEGLTLKNLLRIVHPVPEHEGNSIIFQKIMEESLESPYTWEVELSKNGQLPVSERVDPKQLWTELVTREGSGSLGYMALLRNLRNMKEAGIDDATWKLVAAKLSNPKAVEKSKQLPFGFINSYEVAKESSVPGIVLNALQTATELSLKNMPKLGDRVWIIADCSGSMGMSDSYSYGIGRRQTENSPIKVAAIFASALVKAAKDSFEVKFTMFDDYAKHVDLNPRDSIFTLFEKIMARNAGGGTNLESALAEKPKLGFEPDTVIILSDMEVNRLQSGRNIDNLFKKDCVKVAINLASRDTTPLAEWKGWIQLAGWSPKIFQFVNFTREADSIVKLLYEGKIPLSGEASVEDA